MCSLIIECVLLTNVVCDTQNGTGDALLHCSSRHQVAAKSGYPTFFFAFFCIICFFALFLRCSSGHQVAAKSGYPIFFFCRA